MLKLWLGSCTKEIADRYEVVRNPDTYFEYYFTDLELLKTDYAFRVLRDCSCATEMIYPAGFRTTLGNILPIQKASSGAKVLLLLKVSDLVFNWTWCGDNCNTFIAEVAEEKDVIMYSTRYVNPFERADNLKAVEILNTGRVCDNRKDYVIEINMKGLV